MKQIDYIAPFRHYQSFRAECYNSPTMSRHLSTPVKTGFSFFSRFGWISVKTSRLGLMSLSIRPETFSAKEAFGPDDASFVSLVRDYFAGRKVDFDDVRLDLSSATPFQKQVWLAARRIPYGETRGYRWLAEQTGRPGAARAVGQALGKNPLPVIVPCHRVIGSDGGLGGYSGGRVLKQQLLQLESGLI